MALIPLDTARRITQSPLQGVNQRLMQLINLQQADREAARAERMGNLQAQLLQARIKSTEAQAAARRRAALEKIARGMREREGETLKAISEATGRKLNAHLESRIDEVYDRQLKNERLTAAINFLESYPKIRNQILKGSDLPGYDRLDQYSEEQKAVLAARTWRLVPDLRSEFTPTITRAGVRTGILENMDPDEIRDLIFDQVMEQYGEAIPDEKKQRYRKAIDSLTPDEMLRSTPAQLADSILDRYKFGNAGGDSDNDVEHEEIQKDIENTIMKNPDIAEAVELKVKQLGNPTDDQLDRLENAIQRAYKTTKSRAFDILNSILLKTGAPRAYRSPIQEEPR